MQTKNAINKVNKKGYKMTEEKGLYTFVINGCDYSFRDQDGTAILFSTHFKGAVHPEFFSNLTQLIKFAETDFSDYGQAKQEEVEEVIEPVVEETEAPEITEIIEDSPKVSKNKSSFRRWLETMIEEKGVDIYSEINIEGHYGLTYQSLVEFLEDTPKEHKKIKNTLILIDKKNGDILHYIKHLTNCMIRSSGYDE